MYASEMEPRMWNTFAADRVVFHMRGFTVLQGYNNGSKYSIFCSYSILICIICIMQRTHM